MAATFKGRIMAVELTRWPDQLGFSAELEQPAAKPDAILSHSIPAVPSIQFVARYAQSSLKGQIPLHRVRHRLAVAAASEGSRAGRCPAPGAGCAIRNEAEQERYVADYRAERQGRPSVLRLAT